MGPTFLSKKSIRSSVIKVMDDMEQGKEFTARQFKLLFDLFYGENDMYIDTVMRRVREFCHNKYRYDKFSKLYIKL